MVALKIKALVQYHAKMNIVILFAMHAWPKLKIAQTPARYVDSN
jgi:hypothetical protein